MGFFKTRPEPQSQELTPYPSVSLAEVIDKYRLVSVNSEDGYFIVADQTPKKLAAPDMREIGVSGTSSWISFAVEDYNSQLRGQQGLRKFDEMRRQDGQTAMALLIRKTPVLGARWYIEPASQSDSATKKKDRKIAEYVWKNLTHWSSVSWPLFLQESLLHLDFGWYSFEKVFQRVDGLIRWKKFAPRHPLDCVEWVYDRTGGPRAAKFPGFGPNGNPIEKAIPIEKLIVFTHAKEGGNMQGISVLRPMYKHWFIKDNLYKIDAIQKERHGVGVPLIKLPPNYTTEDKSLAENMGRNLRSNERAHIVLPPNWEVMMLKLEGQPVDVIASAKHHNEMIANSVLAGFVTEAGNVTIEAMMDLFMKATRIDADVVRDVINKWAIPELVCYNWGKAAAENPPELKVRRIGEMTDWRTLTFALRNLVGAQLLQPDRPLLDNIRTEFDLPEADPSTIIQPPTPQAPQAGLPRQSQAGNQRIAPPKDNAGTDRSGG